MVALFHLVAADHPEILGEHVMVGGHLHLAAARFDREGAMVAISGSATRRRKRHDRGEVLAVPDLEQAARLEDWALGPLCRTGARSAGVLTATTPS